jgi:opacity protein-like surface antigen
MKKYLFFAILFASCVFTLSAQTKSELQIGLAVPQGDFADDNEKYAIYRGDGVAGTGFYLGYKLLSPLSTDGLYWTFNAGIMYNDLQSDFKDDWEDEMDDADDYSLPKYLNVPVLAGLQYEKTISDGLNLFGEAGVGLNILKITNQSEEYDYYEDLTTFKPSVKLGFKIGAGIVLQEKYTISLNYLGLGSHKVKYEYEIEYYDEYEYYGESESVDGKLKKALSVSSLNITFGIRF